MSLTLGAIITAARDHSQWFLRSPQSSALLLGLTVALSHSLAVSIAVVSGPLGRAGTAFSATPVSESLPFFTAHAATRFELPLHRSAKPTLADHVRIVVRVRPEKEMGRVAARRIVASMKNTLTIGNRTVRKNPGQAMCSPVLHPSYARRSVAEMESPAAPLPTRVWAAGRVDMLPKFAYFHSGNITLL